MRKRSGSGNAAEEAARRSPARSLALRESEASATKQVAQRKSEPFNKSGWIKTINQHTY
ncbi:hypothetical protein [Lysinibacillus sp. fls2-241-R2A-57]|uniref:hypothetical protein n=1 Tax=Lysinibacillus sp. fls2-241-R2A-57 TaxID=3040292 RepID=UPI002552CC1E|nr:hypothetical protein [Lysinibacillus sp. fls2-241-R2A-57]